MLRKIESMVEFILMVWLFVIIFISVGAVIFSMVYLVFGQ